MRGCSRAAVRPTTPPTSTNRCETRRLWRGGCFPGGAGAGLEKVGAAHLETTAPVEAMGPHSEATPTPHHAGHLSEREPAALQPKRPNLVAGWPKSGGAAGSGNLLSHARSLLTARHTSTRIMTYAHRLTGYRITQGRASTAHHRTTLSQSFMCISAQCMTHNAQTSSCILPSRRASPQHAGSESP